MQLVGQACVHCQQRIPSELDGQFCSYCGSAAHFECLRQAPRTPVGSVCFGCGAPRAVLETRAQAAEAARKETESTERLTTVAIVVAGSTLLVGGVGATIASLVLSGGTLVCIASGAIFAGLGLIIGGLRRAIRR